MKHPSIQFLLTSTWLLWRGSTVYALIHSGFPCLKWSLRRELKFLSYNHPSQLVPSTVESMKPFRTRPSRSFVLILSSAPSPSDASHSSYCKHKRLTIIIMAIIRYEFTIQHFPFFSQCIVTKRKAPNLWHKTLRKKRYELLRILTTISSCWDNSVLRLKAFRCIVEKSWTKWILPRYPLNASNAI